MMLPNVEQLAKLIREKKRAGEEFLLFLGAGASIASGSASWKAIINDFIRKFYPSHIDLNDHDKCIRFYEIVRDWSSRERTAILKNRIEGVKPSIGYLLLADLIKDGFFPLIFTTNWDHHLEDSLVLRGLKTHQFSVKINEGKRGMESEIRKHLGQKVPTMKILKIYGDLRSEIFAITPEERLKFTKALEGVLREYLTKQLVIVGSSMQDVFITKYIADEGKRIWLVKPSHPTDKYLIEAMKARNSDKNVISGTLGVFDSFFSVLASELQISRARAEEVTKVAESPMVPPHHNVFKQYRRGRRHLEFTDEFGNRSPVVCRVIDARPTSVRDVGNYSRLRVHVRIQCAKGKESIEHDFTVGLSDKITGTESVQCPENHRFILSKRLTWLIPHPETDE